MIVVVGCPTLRRAAARSEAAGAAGRIALAAAAAGSQVQLLGKVGDDPDGDALLLELARGGVGHVAVLRDPARPTPVTEAPVEPDGPLGDADPRPRMDAGLPPALEPADVELGLRYLTEFRVIVVADPPSEDLARVVAEASTWTGAAVIAIGGEVDPGLLGLPEDATVLAAPGHDPRTDDHDAFHALVGRIAAAVDGGAALQQAVTEAVGAAGWESAAD